MHMSGFTRRLAGQRDRLLWKLLAMSLVVWITSAAHGQGEQQKPFEPQVGQAGKDVVWVPTPDVMVEKMLDVAKVTPQDLVVDLGSGDGRNVIAAAKRGARGRGVEFNPDMVEYSRRLAEKAGVGDKATFVQGDMFAADVSDATVLALFLLPDNLSRLRDTFFNLKPGTRMVLNTFAIPEWEPDFTDRLESSECVSWCTTLLYIVPAKVAGKWQLPQGELTLEQKFQMISGTLTSGGRSTPVAGKLLGEQITFSAGGVEYSGRVKGDAMEGTSSSGSGASWRATRSK